MHHVRTDLRRAVKAAALLAMAVAPACPLHAAQHWIGARERVLEWHGATPADRIRFGVKDTGIYAVSDLELSLASGLSTNEVARLLDLGRCRLECGGEPVAWSRFDSGIRFFGEALPYEAKAPENVYFATLGESGPQIAARPASPDPAEATNEWFVSTTRVSETTMGASEQLSSTTNHSLLFINRLTSGKSYSRNISLSNPAPGEWNGTATVGMYSLFEKGTDTHSASLKAGGSAIAAVSWDGENVATMTGPFPSSAVADGIVTLEVKNNISATADYPRFQIEWMEVEYLRQYKAKSNVLRCRGGSETNICVDGFFASPVFAWDVTVPGAPVALSSIDTFSTASSTGVVFSCGGPDARYAVFAAQGCYEPSVRGVRDIDWSDSGHAIGHVILIPPEGWVDGFRAALQPLATYRSRQKLRSAIIDVESIYNRYSHGIALPDAIRAFARAACANWEAPPRYLLLVGMGNADYHHKVTGFQSNQDATRCLIPPFIAPQRIVSGSTSYGSPTSGDGVVTIEDALFGDVDPLLRGPEIAVGRFIAVTPAQASAMVARTIAYEQYRPKRQVAVMTSDYPIRTTAGIAFQNSVLRGADALDAIGWRTVRIIPSDGDSKSYLRDERRNLLLPALAADAGFFHYFGHSDWGFLGNSNNETNWMLRYKNITGEMSGEPRWYFPPIAFWICCKAGMWHFTSSTTKCIASYGIFSPDSGFTAMIVSTGLSGDNSGEYFSDSFYSLARDRSTLRLGDAWRDAMCAIASSAYPASQYLCFGILGDPAIIFRPDRPSTGSFLMVR